CGVPTMTSAAGPTTATISFERRRFGYFGHIHLVLARAGQTVLRETEGIDDIGAANSLTVQDLDGDGEPEVMLLLYGPGAGFRSWRIFRYDAARNTSSVLKHDGGDRGTEPVPRDLDGDGRPELLSNDGRYADKYNAFEVAAMPLQIWTYRAGKLHD